ncbi:MAG: FAD-dependent oxidoreductase [Chloroflexota bacterium]|nr:FAD-dependent oxidoreductase [Chloroflexota bacterium]MDE2948232.1 FAD-dependent oxidoreductase [Chloroflexota bacterium]
MRDVVVIGGGLSGLAACYELEKRGAAYTVIEVKRRFGGGIGSSVAGGFIMDACAFAFRRPAADALPPEFDLEASILPLADDICVFRRGSESLARAFACRLGGGRLMRMAVSSLGALRSRFTICLENGIMLDGGALILAAPALYAARMLWNLAPEAARLLTEFRYDAIRRVSLGYHQSDLPAGLDFSPDETFPFIIAVDQTERLPDRDHKLLQVAFRSAEEARPADVIGRAAQRVGGSAAPIAARVDYWPEADLLSDYADDHREKIRAIRELLPPGLSLVGSDYCCAPPERSGVAYLDERICAGRQAAQEALEFLKAGRKR